MSVGPKSGIPSSEFAELLRGHLKGKTVEYVAASAPSPMAFTRRVYDILNGRTQFVTHRVADELSIVCGRPDWVAHL